MKQPGIFSQEMKRFDEHRGESDSRLCSGSDSTSASNSDSGDYLTAVGVEENNLKNISFSFKHNQLIALTGLSGSGKSTLAIDTLYAEGGRRYIETFSPYTRQFLDRLRQPKLSSIHGVRPALALEQRNRATNSRSTVGTVSEINDYLKIIWAHHGVLFCPACQLPIKRDSVKSVCAHLEAELTNSPDATALITFPVAYKKASIEALAATLTREGFIRCFLRSTAEIVRLTELKASQLKKQDREELLIVVDRIALDRLQDQQTSASIQQAFTYGHGNILTIVQTALFAKQHFAEYHFSEHLCCNSCKTIYKPAKPAAFTFNSALGACPTCHGFGKTLAVQRELVVPNPNLSICEGAIVCWNTPATKRERRKLLTFCEEQGINTDKAWKSLAKRDTDLIFEGIKKAKFLGINGWFNHLQSHRHKMHVRVLLARYRGELTCPDCCGSRLRLEASNYRVLNKTLSDFWDLPLTAAAAFFEDFVSSHQADSVSEVPVEEVRSRLNYLVEVGLGYITLNRQTRSLSGGEHQRVNLTSLLGSRLTNTLLVLDEPTIGLHQSDTNRLISTVRALQARGNTVIVVEHDPEMILSADEVIDLGPGSGRKGGEIVFKGSVEQLLTCQDSATGRALASRNTPPWSPEAEKAASSKSRSKTERKNEAQTKRLTIFGAAANNLKEIDVSIPLGQLVVLTGVSGSGKSSLLKHCLSEPLARIEQGLSVEQAVKASGGALRDIQGLADAGEITFIDQHPIGKTPRANPATYTKVWETIRECLADTEDAQQLGLGKSAFSFNVDGGRCPVCSGAGAIRIEMQFLADVFVDCEACGGARFQDRVLTVRLAGKNVIELLDLTLEEAVEMFASVSDDPRYQKICHQLQPLLELGLGYLRLGHPLSALSGGEAQRLKIASHLASEEETKHLFVLDEPTTGLHPDNITQLLRALKRLVSNGHTVLVIEHNLDVIAQADWLIDLGPGGGESGGLVVAEGRPIEVARLSSETPLSITASLLHAWSKGERIVSAENEKETTVQAGKVLAGKALDPCQSNLKKIEVVGARHHNLKNISVSVPQNTLTVVTGVSGSGKSTFAFDIIFAEGQRRYIDCLSPYARQYLKQLSRPDVDLVANIPPTVAISQRTSPPHGISTIATVTEVYQFLRLLYSKVGLQHCPADGAEISSFSTAQMVEDICARFGSGRLFVLAPVVSGRKGSYNDLFQRALKAEITEARIDNSLVKLSTDLRLERHKLHWISLFVASLSNVAKQPAILAEALTQALLLGGGTIELLHGDKHGEIQILSTARMCPTCKRGYRELDPQDFSFRSARGVCEKCDGRGVIENPKRPHISNICPTCQGARIKEIGRNVTVDGLTIDKLTALTAPQLLSFLEQLKLPARLAPILEPILHELVSRLKVVTDVGLDYIKLDRDASTISGGEAQRLRLAKTLGSPLTGVCYVLDEPSIGLHPQDQDKLLSTLYALRDAGNTVLVVEHDEEMIRAADHLIDIGPVGGAEGGHLVAQGDCEAIENNPVSLTGRALRERKNAKSTLREFEPEDSGDWLVIKGATANNLQAVDVRFPVGKLSVVCGVSGAGKSSLVHQTLVPAAISEILEEPVAEEEKTWREFSGGRSLERILEIDQSPVGKTSTSTPASFLGVFDEIRKVYANLPESKVQGYTASYFSCNTGKGRCSHCNGRGVVTVPMSFLPDATTLCEQCNGLRYSSEALEIQFQGNSIGELLNKTMSEARIIFANHKKIRRSLDYINELGLGYLTLGQATSSLSGGETQRLKIARELGLREAQNTLYILDEPTIGLHMTDVEKLLAVLRRLIEKGNTVVLIEHNMDVIKAADYLVEVGPGPGAAGGKLLFSGSPAELGRFTGTSLTKPFLCAPAVAKKTVKNSRSPSRKSLPSAIASPGDLSLPEQLVQTARTSL